jgi:hypothetical protein
MFKGATTISGSAYALLAGSIYSPDSNGRLAWQCSGSPSPRPLPVLVFHGSADLTVNPVNGQQAVRQFLQTNDLADDGLDNDSVKYVPTSTYHGQVPGAVIPWTPTPTVAGRWCSTTWCRAWGMPGAAASRACRSPTRRDRMPR